jgi:phosphoglycerate dehydrogenase-like enzyme
MNEIFSEPDLKRLASFANMLWAEDRELPDSVLENLLPETWAFVAFSPPMTAERLRLGSQLKAILEVGGHFPPTIDYSECFARGVRVLSCAPAFGRQVAEMALSMSLASIRGLVAAHVALRKVRRNGRATALPTSRFLDKTSASWVSAQSRASFCSC